MDIFAFRAEVHVSSVPDLTGFDVEATDGHIGKIDEATMADGATCLVVDTGFWIFGKKRMLPAGVVRAIDVDERKVLIALTKDEVKGTLSCWFSSPAIWHLGTCGGETHGYNAAT